jgi:glycerate dehydrogenase
MEDKTVVLNAARMNYDGLLDLSVLSDHLTVYDATDEPDILPRVAGQSIVVTKELPVRGEILSRFPDSVRLICEAGTGYNNIDLAAARAKGIAVCNVPAYSTDRVATPPSC